MTGVGPRGVSNRPYASSHTPFLAALVPVIASIAIYLPALSNGFVWDDPLVLQQLRAIRSAGDLVVLPPVIPRYYFRPFIFVSYLFDRTLGEKPRTGFTRRWSGGMP